MFQCSVCQSQSNEFTNAILHAKKHGKIFKNTIDYFPPYQILGEYEFSRTIIQRISTSDSSLIGRLKDYEPGLPDVLPTNGGVHKAFDANRALVYAKTPSAMKDFSKEIQMKKALDSLELIQNGTKIRDIFFSFQNFVENINANTDRYRRVSIYNSENLNKTNYIPKQNQSDPSLNGYYQILKNEIKYSFVFDTTERYETLRNFVVQMIHQLVYIHYCMYIGEIQHVDLHMGNIKIIIDNNLFPIIKAFDFGKSKNVNSSNDNLKDLNYFISRKAVSGLFETIKRNKLREADSIEQMKHYPLHRLSCLLLNHQKNKFTEQEFIHYIEKMGKEFLVYLKNLQKSTHSKENTRVLFQAFSRGCPT